MGYLAGSCREILCGQLSFQDRLRLCGDLLASSISLDLDSGFISIPKWLLADLTLFTHMDSYSLGIRASTHPLLALLLQV